ncbi:MAG: prolyl oligopeptidase family serine peptidase [Clostridium sp.]|nr:prolyl oligopeptidase family serine peptidase [Bacteroides sp.]MCM1199130.1 prolyl oligopeptidase family serine peptidase [Clostridium sp.]
MKKTAISLLLTGLAIAVSASGAHARDIEKTLRSQGTEREYKLHIPDSLPDNAPLVIVLHGYGSTNSPERFGMNAAADRHGFAVCYPLGVKDSRGKTCWNVGYPFQKDMGMDDIRFLRQLVRHLQKEFGFSRENVFCTGMSNGGDMCYMLAAQAPELFAALAPVAGFMSVEIMRNDRSHTPVPLLEIHGTMDRTTRWEGDLDNNGGWGAYVSIPVAVQYFAAKGKCTRFSRDTLSLRSPGDLQVVAHRYSYGTEGTEVWLYESIGGKHSWGKIGVDTCETIWKFFSRFMK